MNTRQKNKVQSHKTRIHFLKTAPEIAQIKGLPAKLEAYGRKISRLDTLTVIQNERTRTAAARDASHDEMRETSLMISGVALSYADEKEVPGLAEQVKLSPNDFAQARLDDRVQLAQQLHAAVLPLVPELVEYGITDESMDDFRATIDRAAAALPLTRAAEADRRVATREINVAIRGLDELEKNQILPLLLPLKKSHPEVYQRYLVCREVLDRPGARAGGDKKDEAPVGEATEGASTAPAVVAKTTPGAESPAKAA